MNCGLVILCWIAAVVADDTWTVKHFAELTSARNKCAATLNIPAETFTQYENRVFSDTDPLDRSYVKCMAEELGIFGENGFYIDRVVSQFLTETSDASRFEQCATRTDADTTDDIWIFRAFRCFTRTPASYTQFDVKN